MYWTAIYLETALKIKSLHSFINIGSSAIYGKQKKKLLHEDLKPNPITDYGISKYLQEKLVMHFKNQLNCNSISTRTFNLFGPNLSNKLVIGKIINEFQKVKNGAKDFIEIGRIDSIRDFIDIRDAVKIYWLLSDVTSDNMLFNIASGNSYSIKEIYNYLTCIYGFSPRIKKHFITPFELDVDRQNADISRLNNKISISNYYTIEKTLLDMYNAIQ